MAQDWDDAADTPAAQAQRIVAGLVRLAGDDEACRLLGIEGTLEDELDVTFLNDPLSWVANEIAGGVRAADDEDEGVALSTVLALVRLYRTLRGGALDEREILDAVMVFLNEEEE